MLQSEFVLLCDEKPRRDVAKLVHEYIRDYLKEEDEIKINAAFSLKDIYDCGVCAGHIAQVYVKGIMEPVSRQEFGIFRKISKEELALIFDRIHNRRKRVIPDMVVNILERKYLHIPYSDAIKMKEENRDVQLIDVRSGEAFELGESKDTLNIPLSKIALNPHIIGGDLFSPVIFVCESGTMAEIAAGYALDAGYTSIYFTENSKK